MPQKFLTREEILSAPDVIVRAVESPEFGGTVGVRAPECSARDAWERDQILLKERGDAAGKSHQDLLAFRSRFLAMCLCDAEGRLLFTAEDVEALGRRNSKAMDRLYSVARQMAGLTAADERALLGNSDGAPSGASGSDSH